MTSMNRLGVFVVSAIALSSLVGTGCDSDDAGGLLLFQKRKVKTTATPPPPPPPEPEPQPEPEPGPAGPASFASRASGVAPLGVFFDAVNTSGYDSGVTQPGNSDYGAFHYAWDFGDSNSGTWSTNGRSRNADTGFTAAHVYETPGTYTARLTVTDASGTTHVYAQDITVTAFSGTTYYFSNSGSDSNDGLSPSTAWRTWGKMIAEAAPNRRFLFNRGETFTTGGNCHISETGPGIIGAYGSGNRPIIQSSSSGTLVLSGSDWRAMDLEFAGPGSGPGGFGMALEAHIQMRQALMLRIKSQNYYGCLGWGDWSTIYETPHEEIIVADCQLTNGGDYNAFVGGRRLAFIGNTMGTVSGAGHVLRIWQADKGVIAHNNLVDGYHHSIKLHGPPENDIRPKTKFVHISDNLLAGSVWTVAIGPQNNVLDERVNQVVIERNWFRADSEANTGLRLWAQDVTVRNNVFIGNGASGYCAVAIERRGVEPAATRIRVSNNTMYKGDGGNDFLGVYLTSAVSDITVRNNIVSAPSVTGMFLIGNCSGLVTESNLLSNSPGFTNAGALNFTLTDGSAARNTGMTLTDVRTDYTRTMTRPQGSAYDLGAFERD